MHYEFVGPVFSSSSITATGTELDIFERIAQSGSNTANLTVTTGDTAAMTVLVYSGVDQALPIDSHGRGATNSGTSVSLPSLNAALPGEVLMTALAASGPATATASWTPPSGMTTEQTASTTGLTLLTSADQALPSAGPTGTKSASISGVGAPLAAGELTLQPPAGVMFYQQDGQGSTRVLTDLAGRIRATYDYDPYGRVVATPTNTAGTLFLYDGQYTDFESGLVYLRSRFYEPITGQFLSRDPITNVTQEPYSYVLDDPVNLSDPTGLCAGRRANSVNGPIIPGVSSEDLTACAYLAEDYSYIAGVTHHAQERTQYLTAAYTCATLADWVQTGQARPVAIWMYEYNGTDLMALVASLVQAVSAQSTGSAYQDARAALFAASQTAQNVGGYGAVFQFLQGVWNWVEANAGDAG